MLVGVLVHVENRNCHNLDVGKHNLRRLVRCHLLLIQAKVLAKKLKKVGLREQKNAIKGFMRLVVQAILMPATPETDGLFSALFWLLFLE